MTRPEDPFVYPVPATQEVIMPDYFRKTTIESLNVDQVIFPAGTAFAIDKTTRALYVSTQGYLLDDETLEPSHFGQRAGLMRVAPIRKQAMAAEHHEVYVADLRCLSPNNILELHITDDDPYIPLSYQQYNAQQRWVQLAAAVVNDPDGNQQLLGNSFFSDEVQFVMDQTDRKLVDLHGTKVAPASSPATSDVEPASSESN